MNQVSEMTTNDLILSRIDTLSENILDSLAWQFHVEAYSESLAISQKREFIKAAIKNHRYKGTPYAIKTTLAIIANDVKVEEWFKYQGKPYYFKLCLPRMLTSKEEMARLLEACKQEKNVRSWLDGISTQTQKKHQIFMGMQKRIKKHISIYPADIQNAEGHSAFYYGVASALTEEIELKGV